MAPILWTKNLAKSFGGLHAVQGLDFSMNEGEVVAIIGPNGSGKTTFFNLIMQLYEVTSGSIHFGPEGRNLAGMPTHQIHRLGIARTFQTLRLLPNLTVLENVLVGMSRRSSQSFWRSLVRPPSLRSEERQAENEALELLSFFGPRLLSMCNEPASSLSYANRRRLEITRAMASDPKLILLDEPVAGMNPTETREVMSDVKRLNARGFTILLIEHDMTLVRGVAQRVVAFDHGTKIAEGTFDQVSSDARVIEAYLGRRASAEFEERKRMSVRITVDTGGTFTDVVVSDRSGSFSLGKALTTPARSFDGMRAAIEVAARRWDGISQSSCADTDMLIYGTTRATNAIVTRSTAKTAFLTTEASRDILVLKEGGKFDPHDFCHDYPEPYIPRRHTFEIASASTREGGVVTPARHEGTRSCSARIGEQRVRGDRGLPALVDRQPRPRAGVGELIERGAARRALHAVARADPDPARISPRLDHRDRRFAEAADAAAPRADGSGSRAPTASRGELLISTSVGGCMHVGEIADRPIHTVKSGPAMAPVAGRVYADDREARRQR